MAASCVAGSGSVRAVAQQCVTASSSSSATAMATATAKGDCLSPSAFCSKLTACQNQHQQQPQQGSSSGVRHVSAFRSKSTPNGFAVQLTGCGTIDIRRPLRRWPSSSSTTPGLVKATTDNVEAAEVEAPPSTSGGGEECNDATCAPEKEVGKVSMSWEAQEKTKVTGTYPPMAKPAAVSSSSSTSSSTSSSLPPSFRAPSARAWTGYVEKDTAGQTNIYSVEPTVYEAEGPMSSTTLSAGIGGILVMLGVCGALVYVATGKPVKLEQSSAAPIERLDKGSGRSEIKRARALGLNLPEDFPEQAPEPVAAPASSPELEATSEAPAEAEADASDLPPPASS